jgi:hypothetical protein
MVAFDTFNDWSRTPLNYRCISFLLLGLVMVIIRQLLVLLHEQCEWKWI